ncbi:MAG: CvpA family protein [Saprospiraceae bacterium]|jgi:membrane protein required for colicin V production
MIIDLILVVLVASGFFVGYSRGIIKTIFSVIGMVVAVFLAFRFSSMVAQGLSAVLNSNTPFMFILAIFLIFGVTFGMIKLAGTGLEKIFKSINLNFMNQAAGGLLLGAIFTLFYAGILWFADKSNFISEDLKKESATYYYLQEYPGQLLKVGKYLKPYLEVFWEEASGFSEKMLRESGQK